MANYSDIKYQAAGSATAIYADMAALIAATGMSAGDQALVTALNKVFMYTGTAWYTVATMTNASPSAITSVDATYDLATDGTATTITAVSTDPEGFPLTWSYAVTTGSLGSTATVSQADNVFTITPSTTEADAGTFSITFSVTDGATGAVNAVSAFTLSFITYINDSIVLYIDAGDTSSYSNVVADISGNSHTTTLQGTPIYTEVTGSDSSGTSSYFTFTGGTQGITTNLQRDNDSFTYSAWVYPTSLGSTCHIINTFENTSQEWTSLGFNSTGRPDWLIDNNGSKKDLLGNTLSINTWYNIVGTYNGSTSSMKLYINGTLETSTTHSVTSTILGLAPLSIAIRNGNVEPFVGRIGIVQTYSKELSQAEITTNWDYYRGRYGL